MEQTHPTFADIIDVIEKLPAYPEFQATEAEPMAYLSTWLSHYSRTLDVSRGFLVNRCALYWAGYDAEDAFDGQAFVDSCQDSKGALRELAQTLDTDLQIFELDPHTHTKRTADELAMAASYGMMGIEENTQLLSACSFGQGVETNATIAIEHVKEASGNLEGYMMQYCGLDIAALVGASCAAILKGIPMIVEGASGRLAKLIIESATGNQYDSIIVTDDLNLPLNHSIPGQKMIITAIMLKALYAAQEKTDCGKVKAVA